MAGKLGWCIPVGVIVGAEIASVTGHHEMLIALFMAVGVGAASVWHYMARES